MKRNIFFIVLAFTLIIIIFLSIKFSSDTTEDLEILTEAKLGTFKVEVTSAGELDAKNSVNIEGPFGLRRARIWEVKIEDMVDEGTVVKKGDYVARLDAAELSDRIQNEDHRGNK
jgi:multidrug efflux pump subunit AcrA (membrane-fusion protein)